MDCSAIFATRVKAQAQVLISLRVLRVHAQCGARFGDRVLAVVQAVENVGEAAVVLRKIWFQLQRLRDLVEGIVPLILLTKHRAESEVQSTVPRVVTQSLSQ